jgi:excisionase family DNA binding protein
MTTPEDRARALTAGVSGRPQVHTRADREYVTVAEAVRMLNVVRRTIDNWLNTGKITRYRAPNGYGVRIDKQELLEYNAFRTTGAVVLNPEEITPPADPQR